MDCISSCISCNELTLDKHVYWFKSAAHWIACLYNSLVNQKHIVGVYVSSREVAATDNSCSEPWTMKPNRIWMPRRTPLVIRGCSILRPFGQQLSHLFFSKLKLSNPKFKNIKNSKKTYETNVSSTQKINMQNAMMKKKTAKIPFFSCSK